MRELVAALMEEARKRAQDDLELARLIAPLVGHHYGRQAVGTWGRTVNPPAFVLLAACQVTGISVDEYLFGESLREGLARVQERLGRTRKAASLGLTPFKSGTLGKINERLYARGQTKQKRPAPEPGEDSETGRREME